MCACTAQLNVIHAKCLRFMKWPYTTNPHRVLTRVSLNFVVHKLLLSMFYYNNMLYVYFSCCSSLPWLWSPLFRPKTSSRTLHNISSLIRPSILTRLTTTRWPTNRSTAFCAVESIVRYRILFDTRYSSPKWNQTILTVSSTLLHIIPTLLFKDRNLQQSYSKQFAFYRTTWFSTHVKTYSVSLIYKPAIIYPLLLFIAKYNIYFYHKTTRLLLIYS